MNDSDPDIHQGWRAWRRSTTFWLRFALVAAFLSFVGQVTALVASATSPAPPTLHTRRITIDGRTVTLEIPDGQCATALGVRICVPDSSARKVSP